MNKGLFIVFEGGEGTGKTTAIEKIYNWLTENNIDCIMTREPGGIKISERIREVILDKEHKTMDGRTEALLYAAARRQHLVEKVIPALNEGKVVLCDRFVHSSLAYQGFARGLGVDEVYKINEFAIEGYMPDLVIFFDLKPEIGLERINSNSNREINRLDLEKIDFHHKVRDGYKKVTSEYGQNNITIDASKSKEEVENEIKSIIEKYIAL